MSGIIWGIMSGSSLEDVDINESKSISSKGMSTVKLGIILFGSAAILYSAAKLLEHFHPIFDDVHDSDSETDSTEE